MFKHLYLISLYILYIVPKCMGDICSTCLCSGTGTDPIINCHKKQLGNNDMLNVDLLLFNEHQAVNELILSDNNIVQLPGHILKKLKNLRSLDLSRNVMEDVHTGMFADLRDLENLNLSNNLLKKFDGSLLKILPKLEILNLSYNHISAIEYAEKDQIESITFLDLSHNNISNISNEIFHSLPNLRFLDLSYNKIHLLNGEGLAYLSNLQTFRINNNFLTSLNIQMLPNSLQELYSGHNAITKVIYGRTVLKLLSIEYNEISELEMDLRLQTDLRYLNVSGNALTDFPKVSLEELTILDISHNKLTNIPESISTENLPALLDLNISENPIAKLMFQLPLRLRSFTVKNTNLLETIDQDTFSNLDSIPNECINLTISHNEKLLFIHENALKHMNICSLDLSYNHITHVSSNLIPSNINFESFIINLQGNPYNCNCSLQWMLSDLLPKLYSLWPNLLDDLRCASPPQISNMRMVHWYGWKGQVFCTDMSDFVENLIAQDVSASSTKVVVFESSDGLLAVLGTSIALLAILVIIGLLLTRRYSMRRSRFNRRF